MHWHNDITKLLNIDYPIIQAPMFGVTTPSMAAAASNTKCLGTLALADISGEQCIDAIRAARQLTRRPFAVNIFAHDIPELTDALRSDYTKAKTFVEKLAAQHGLTVHLPSIDELTINTYHEQLEAIISEKCRILSFTFGIPDQQSIDLLKSHGIILAGTCTSVHEAIALEQSGIDVICVQGWEAGGHRGEFVCGNTPKGIGGLSLLARVREAVKTPIIYAGGIYNAKTLLASKKLGADGVQVGSLLLCSEESALQDFEKERLKNVDESDIILTRSFSGRWARGIKNTFTTSAEQHAAILPYPYQNKLTSELRRVAKSLKNTEFINIWAGQSIHEYSEQSTADIIRALIHQTEEACSY